MSAAIAQAAVSQFMTIGFKCSARLGASVGSSSFSAASAPAALMSQLDHSR
jgi:hypothetical protein